MAKNLKVKDFGWVSIEGDNGLIYGCQTQRKDWWNRVSGIAKVYDVGEASGRVPPDVIDAVNASIPDRVK